MNNYHNEKWTLKQDILNEVDGENNEQLSQWEMNIKTGHFEWIRWWE